MLILTRKVGESIRIGDDIVVTVTKLSGNRVQFGVEAPKDIRIVRGELQTPDFGTVRKQTRVVAVPLGESNETFGMPRLIPNDELAERRKPPGPANDLLNLAPPPEGNRPAVMEPCS